MQLVEHVCHCDDALVNFAEKNTDYERGVQLIMGKVSQQQDCCVVRGLKVRRAVLSGSVQLMVGG